MKSWRELIESEMSNHGESWEDVTKHTMSPEELDRKFETGFGTSEGCSFTLWTMNRVYFPVVYDGSEWAASVPRHPSEEATDHVGGQ